MTDSGAGPVRVPARMSVSGLAEALHRPSEDVIDALAERFGDLSPTDLVGPDQMAEVGRALGYEIVVEMRDLVLEALYQAEVGEAAPDVSGLPSRAARLISGVMDHREELDGAIEQASEHWSVARMPVIDRTILRLGLYELRFQPDTPTGVIVSEALRLAQTYSTERSGSFVNGVLASLARQVRA